MPRQQTQDQGRKGRNPGTLTPDDDDSVEANADNGPDAVNGQANEGQQATQGERREAQDDRRRRPEQNIEQVEDEEAEDDEDESDSRSQQP
jgi:hypothetical protein